MHVHDVSVQVHRKIPEALSLLMNYGCMDLNAAQQSTVSTKQFADVMSNLANGSHVIVM